MSYLRVQQMSKLTPKEKFPVQALFFTEMSEKYTLYMYM